MKQSRLQQGLRATFLGLLANVVLAAGKLVAGVAGHSQALVADGVESVADVLSSLIVWRGLVVAAAPADEDHPYGHGKAEPLAAAIVSTVVIAAAVWIATQAVRDILRPAQTPAAYTLWVLLFVFVVKESLFRYAIRKSRTVQSVAVHSDAWHHRADAITSLCAAIGITVALVGGPRYKSADDWAALAAAGIIAFNGLRVLRPAMSDLMDTANFSLSDRIKVIAESVTGVAGVEKCLVRKMGFQFFADMHIEVDPQMTVQRAHQIAHDVKDRIRDQEPDVADVLIHIEPAGGDGVGD